MTNQPRGRRSRVAAQLDVEPQSPPADCTRCLTRKHALWRHQGKLLCYQCLLGELYNQPVAIRKEATS